MTCLYTGISIRPSIDSIRQQLEQRQPLTCRARLAAAANTEAQDGIRRTYNQTGQIEQISSDRKAKRARYRTSGRLEQHAMRVDRLGRAFESMRRETLPVFHHRLVLEKLRMNQNQWGACWLDVTNALRRCISGGPTTLHATIPSM